MAETPSPAVHEKRHAGDLPPWRVADLPEPLPFNVKNLFRTIGPGAILLASSIGGAAPSVYAADCAPPGLNATTVSVFRMTGDIGYVGGPLLLGLIMDLYGPETSLIVAAGLLIALRAKAGGPAAERVS